MSSAMADDNAGTSDKNGSLKNSQGGTTVQLGPRTQSDMSPHTNQMDSVDMCNCGPCQRFWRDVIRNSCATQAKEERGLALSMLGKSPNRQFHLAVGDRVSVQGKTGFIKFVDFVDDNVVAPVLRVGIRLDEPVPEGHDGVYQGKRYFHCTDGHGVFARVTEVVPQASAVRRPPVRGNTMFPSWPDVCKKRRDQEALQEARQERERKATARRLFLTKQATPPAISPRENRANQLRRDMICLARLPGAHLAMREDPFDVAVKDHRQKQGPRKDVLVASMLTPRDSNPTPRGLRKQWQEKYHDPEKVTRMEETLIKLCSAYREGSKFRHLYAD